MGMTFGAFKGVYRGTGVYYDGHYNADGSFPSRTMAELRLKIDKSIAEQEAADAEKHAIRLAEARKRGLWAERNGDVVKLHTPDGERTLTIRQYRNEVFDIEEKYDADVVFA